MKRIILAFALLLLLGCIWPWGGGKDELELVPKHANVVVILRPAATFSDSDIAIQNWEDISYSLNRTEETTGINPMNIDRLVLFMKFDSLRPPSGYYGGFIARGGIEKDKILERMAVSNVVTQISYGDHVLYEIYPNGMPLNKSYFSFLDGNTLVGGTRQAVQDSIDTSVGRAESVKSTPKLSQTYDSFDKSSLLIFLMNFPPQLKSDINNSREEQLSPRVLSHVDCVGLSLMKKAKTVNVELFVSAEDAPSASDISNSFDKMLSLMKGLAPSGSTVEAVLKKINVEANGNKVAVTLSSNPDELKKLRDDLYAFQPRQ
jgi:hypothetical protein